MTSLEYLGLVKCEKLTKQDIQALKAALPDCNIQTVEFELR